MPYSDLMHLGFSQPQQRFLSEIRAFLSEHWPADEAGVTRRYRRAFLAALDARGWSVPEWPEAHGGLRWSPLQRYLCDRELAGAGAPLLDPLSVDVVGPVLLETASAAQQRRYLPGIRAGRQRWCVHGSLLGGKPLVARRAEAGFRLAAERLHARDAARSDFLLAAVCGEDQRVALVILPLKTCRTTAGLLLEPDEIAEPGTALEVLNHPGAMEVFGRAFEQARRLPRGRVARTEQQLAGVASLLERLGGPAEADLSARLDALRIALLGLDGLEQRAMQGGESDAMAGLLAAVRLKTAAVVAELSTLTVEALGYYALPALDPVLNDNEGLVGPVFAQDAIAELFGYVGSAGASSADWLDRETIASRCLRGPAG